MLPLTKFCINDEKYRTAQNNNTRYEIIMSVSTNTENINCPLCSEATSINWAEENGYTAVKCVSCGLVYVNPRPSLSLISEAVKTGVHSDVEHGRTAIVRRVVTSVARYKNIISYMFSDVWHSNKPISWLDVGAGYGEFVEAVTSLAPSGSRIEGLEPMKPKADDAKKRGLKIKEMYLSEVSDKYDILSLINVFSHIPDFNMFLKDVKNVLTENGEIFLETGNTGDLISCHEVPGELDLPDHLVFAGEKNIIAYLNEAGFSIIYIKRIRIDGLINFTKCFVKKLLGRKVTLSIPYTSKYRTLLVRAKLLTDESSRHI